MEMTLIIVSIVSLLAAAVMSVITWRLLQTERLRSSARVEALAAEIHEDPIDPAMNFPAREVVDDFVLRRVAPDESNEMFASAPQRSRWPVVAGAFAVLALAILGTAMLL